MEKKLRSSAKKTNLKIELSSYSIKKIEKQSLVRGFSSSTEYIKSLIKRDEVSNKLRKKTTIANTKSKIIFDSKLGKIIHGNSLSWLHDKKNCNSTNLIITSPPFGLLSKKSYGNEHADDYCDWFRPFAEGFHNVLKNNGSLVIDIAGVWIKGNPIRSLYHFDVLQMLCKEYGFFLCQEHYWWNPGKMPSPASWVTVDRVRVVDAINCVWWLSKTPNPKASNLNILRPYSERMKRVLKNGIKSGVRPSGHEVTQNFLKNNGGSIPHNLLAIANTESNGAYFDYCKKYDLPIHPARFPASLPDYFIRFLTKKGDLVVDPFGGSSVTGYVAENLGRNWRTIEKDLNYALSGRGRFLEKKPYKSLISKYEIASPGTFFPDD
jgi:DNA modification methylase